MTYSDSKIWHRELTETMFFRTAEKKWGQAFRQRTGLRVAVVLSCLLLFCVGVVPTATAEGPENSAGKEERCVKCHAVELDEAHRLACSSCHKGDEAADDKEKAHAGLIAHPAHPDHMDQYCAPCHQQTHDLKKSSHFTLAGEINLVRSALGSTERIVEPTEIPDASKASTLQALGDDMLRRRCLRCHLYSNGDRYPETVRGTGCAACHLAYSKGKLVSHRFVARPRDEECLHCHYGNFVGADYYGRFEHDYNWEYRTPFQPDGFSLRPYGVEYHQLVPDVHQLAGMACIDCHGMAELMGTKKSGRESKSTVACTDCHRTKSEAVRVQTRRDGQNLMAPGLKHPAHERYGSKVGCAVCHAQWSFFDDGTHLLRLDVMDYSPWSDLTVQSSNEVELQLEEDLYGSGGFDKPFMQDKFTGDNRLGLWLKGFGQRRWERQVFCTDDKGRLQVCRPELDLYLSYVNEEEQTSFDSVPAPLGTKRFQPYVPHTIGKAGMFYLRKLQEPQGQGATGPDGNGPGKGHDNIK